MMDVIRQAGNAALKSGNLCTCNPGYLQKKEGSVDLLKAHSSFHQNQYYRFKGLSYTKSSVRI